MTKLIIPFALQLLAITVTGQIPNIPSVQPIINGKRCDTCLVKYHIQTSNTLEYTFIGGYFNSGKLNDHLRSFKNNLPKENYEQRCYVTPDSIISIAFNDHSHIKKNPNATSFLFEEGFDYNHIKVSISINKKQIIDTIPLKDLKPLKNFVINEIQYNPETGADNSIGERPNNGIENIHLKTGDILKIVLYNTKIKAVELTLNIKRVFDQPSHFVYFSTPIRSINIKENLQSFLSSNINKENISFGDSTTLFSLEEGNLGVFNFNSLESSEIIEYRMSGEKEWKSVRRPGSNPFEEQVYIIVDNNDVPPGTTQALIFRYKDLPGSELRLTIKGEEHKTKINWLAISGIVVLTTLAFSGFYILKQQQDRKQIRKLHQKNKDIETRLSLLSGQLNPHFLFNSLHAIQGTINSNNINEANEYISSVANFMRNIMDYGKKEFISLKEELGLETDYLKLEQKRNHFSFNTYIEPGIDTALVDFPPLLLQPVLENSLRHAFVNSASKPILEILINAAQNDLIISIKDNGVGWNTAVHSEGHGLSLVRKRIELLNEKMADMPISTAIIAAPNEGTNTIFTFKNWLA